MFGCMCVCVGGILAMQGVERHVVVRCPHFLEVWGMVERWRDRGKDEVGSGERGKMCGSNLHAIR